jgi:hypothetical protein
MNKPRKSPKTKAPKAATTGSEEIAPRVAPVKSFALDDWLAHVSDHAKAMASSPKGACLVADPSSGGNNCILTDQATCTKLGGTWIGGPCGPN